MSQEEPAKGREQVLATVTRFALVQRNWAGNATSAIICTLQLGKPREMQTPNTELCTDRSALRLLAPCALPQDQQCRTPGGITCRGSACSSGNSWRWGPGARRTGACDARWRKPSGRYPVGSWNSCCCAVAAMDAVNKWLPSAFSWSLPGG